MESNNHQNKKQIQGQRNPNPHIRKISQTRNLTRKLINTKIYKNANPKKIMSKTNNFEDIVELNEHSLEEVWNNKKDEI